jgi:Rieske 2Fe-2S family protein
LQQEFYNDPTVYDVDVEAIWRKGWVFAGHTCEIPQTGDFVELRLANDSILILRDEFGKVQALHNVCRHRGSLICGEACGRVKKLVCPYHRWAYSLDGSLFHAPGMQEDLDKSQLGLKRVAHRETAGLIFISLADNPSNFSPADSILFPLLKPQGFERAKVAKCVDYVVKANWKLVWENNRECFHCNANHPQFGRHQSGYS